MDSSPSSPSYTVLRIKRKATDSPLSSLVIQDAAAQDRKKRRDIAGKPRGVFRLAETVPHTWDGTGSEGEALKSRIKSLLQSIKPRSGSRASSVSSTSRRPPPRSIPSGTENDPGGGESSVGPPTENAPLPKRSSSLQAPTAPTTTTTTQYRVVPPLSPRTRMMLPPKVLSSKEVESGKLVLVDAQAVYSEREAAKKVEGEGHGDSPEDKDMAAFLPMLQEYLKLDRSSSEAARDAGSKSEAEAEAEAEADAARTDSPAEDGYVYDLYYRDLRPDAVNVFSMGVGDGVTPLSFAVGALIGYEDFSPPSTPSESEDEDEADEDSNEEDYYRNDYPEDEDADEDMEGFRGGDGGESDDDGWSSEGGGGSGSGSGEEGGRGAWDYR